MATLLLCAPGTCMKQQRKNLAYISCHHMSESLTSENGINKSSYCVQKPHAPSTTQIQEIKETNQLLCAAIDRSFHVSATKTTPCSCKARQRRNYLPVTISVWLMHGFIYSPWSLLLREGIVLRINQNNIWSFTVSETDSFSLQMKSWLWTWAEHGHKPPQ